MIATDEYIDVQMFGILGINLPAMFKVCHITFKTVHSKTPHNWKSSLCCATRGSKKKMSCPSVIPGFGIVYTPVMIRCTP